MQQLIAELNEILAHDIIDEDGLWKKNLTTQSHHLFDFFPQAIQEQLLLERDPHGNVQVSVFSLWLFFRCLPIDSLFDQLYYILPCTSGCQNRN